MALDDSVSVDIVNHIKEGMVYLNLQTFKTYLSLEFVLTKPYIIK